VRARSGATGDVARATSDPTTASAAASHPPPRRVMHRRASSRGVPLPDAGADRAAWSERAGSSLARSDGAPGVQAPFAGLIPLPGGPVSPRARAHVSFVPLVPPRLIFVGVTHAPRENGDLQGVWAGDEVASTSGLRSRLRSARPAHVGRTSDPALGFASCRVGGHLRPCIRAVSTPLGSPASGKERPPNGSRHPYPLVGFLASFPSTTCFSRRI
jgi:hypothetical protein